MSSRIARLAGKKGARLTGNDQPEVEKSADDQASYKSAEGSLDESNSFQASPLAETITSKPQVETRKTRTKWTKEEYKEIIYCYYQAKNNPNSGSITKETYQLWRQRNPTSRPNMDEVKLANQRRWIERQKKLSNIEIDLIRQQVQAVNNNADSDPEERLEEERNDEQMNETQQDQQAHQSQNINTQEQKTEMEKEQYNKMLEKIQKKFADCKECEIFERTPLYKVNPKKSKIRTLITYANEAIEQIKKEQLLTFDEVNHLVYAAAAVVTETAGIKPRKKKKQGNKNKQPFWKVRIQKQIQEMRAELSLIAEIENGNNSDNIKKKKKRLIRKYNINSQANLEEVKETIKMKVQAKAQRLRRYDKRTKQYRQNKLFYEDRKKLYRELGKEQIKVDKVPTKEEVDGFWRGILEKEVYHNGKSEWVKREHDKHSPTPTQQWDDITTEEVKEAISNTNNWKSPGLDFIPNFWLKHLNSVHNELTRLFNGAVREPETAPAWLTTGKTYLLPKNKNTEQPQNYRPITCLTTMYKILTSVITNRCYQHLDDNDILPEEQKGCKKGSYGCKDQLLINKMIMEDCMRKKKNLSMAWIDYQKAFDSVPHSWLIETLKIYKFNNTLINFLERFMNNWNTNMHLRSDDGNEIITDTINIKRGIFQGDSLSPLLFCVALIPLTSELNATGFGYNISKNSPNVSHLFYMDDLKLYSKTEQQLQGALHVVKKFSDDIEMKFGLSKCAKATLKGGKLIKKENIEIDVATTIKDLQQDNTYKYLGVDESEGIQHSKMKEKIRKEYYRRTKLVLKSELSAKNKIDSINSIAVPVVQYSFGIIDWKASEIASLDRKTRKLLTMHKALHPRSDVDRLYVQRKHGGRGLIQLEASFKTAIVGLDCYLSLKDEVKLRMVERHENSKRKYSIVKIARKVKQEHGLEEVVIEQERTPSQNAKVLKKKLREKIEEKRIERWQEKPLHGQYLTNTQKPYVDQESTHLWLTSGDLKGETEGYIIAAQDQSLMTRNYQHNILHQGTDDLCRLCHTKTESVDHILTNCEVLAPTQYLKRHNDAAAYMHWTICKDHDIPVAEKWYEHEPPRVVSKDHITIMWDYTIHTDRKINANRPDIVVKDTELMSTKIIDMSVPSDRNICLKNNEKKRKYKDLEIEVSRMWHTKTETIPVIIGALGTIKHGMKDNVMRISKNIDLKILQKIVLLGSAHVMRNVGL